MKGRRYIKKLMCILLALVMTVAFIPGGLSNPEKASAATKITEVDVYNITMPYGGKNPDSMCSVPPWAKYHLSSKGVTWHHKFGNGNPRQMDENDEFIQGQQYFCSVSLKADSGYEFAGENYCKYMINGRTSLVNLKMSDIFTTEITLTSSIMIADGDGFNVKVDGGSGSGKYLGGERVTLRVNELPKGKMFDGWEVVSGGVTLANRKSATTTFTMPRTTVSIKAVYKNIPDPKTVSVKLYGYDDINVTWTKVDGVAGYKVYYKKSTETTYRYKGSTSGTSMKLPNLSDGVRYYLKVVPYAMANGIISEGRGKLSSGTFTLKKISTPRVARLSPYDVAVKWNNIQGVSGYQISRSTSRNGTRIVGSVGYYSGNLKIVPARKGKTYYYKVRAYRLVDGKRIYAPWSNARAYRIRW